MRFTISGKISFGKEERAFSKTVEAASVNAAREKSFALLGSQNGVKRNMIKIEKVEEAQ